MLHFGPNKNSMPLLQPFCNAFSRPACTPSALWHPQLGIHPAVCTGASWEGRASEGRGRGEEGGGGGLHVHVSVHACADA